MSRLRPVPVALLALALGPWLAGCGTTDDPVPEESRATPGTGPDTSLRVRVDPETGTAVEVPTEARLFAVDSPWNTRVDAAPAHPDSSVLMDLATLRTGIDGDGQRTTERIDAGLYINTESWTVPVVSGGEPTEVVCRQSMCGDGDDTVLLDIPADVDPDPRYDGWFTVIDEDEGVAHDLWRARREDDGSISYHFMRSWDLDGPGYADPQQAGARGSGLPLAAGLIRPGELENGLIEHALAISLPGPAAGSFLPPASTTDGTGDIDSIPEGARIRLRVDAMPDPPVDPVSGKPLPLTRTQQRMADAIVAALRTYGAIVVDRAAVPTLYAQRDVTADLLDGNELQGLRLDDFEVVRFAPGDRVSYPADDDGVRFDETFGEEGA